MHANYTDHSDTVVPNEFLKAPKVVKKHAGANILAKGYTQGTSSIVAIISFSF